MFFIIWAIIAAAVVLAVLLIKVKIELIAVQNDITLNIIFFGFIKLTKKYVIKREEETFLTLYFVKKERMKKVTTLEELVKKALKNDSPDITLINIINLFLQKAKPKNNGYRYTYRRMKYIIKAFFKIGTGDAYSSALICGFLGAVSSALCASRNNKAHRTIVNLSPEFSKQVFFVRVNCIIVIAPADIIIGYLISKKNEAVRKNASDREYNADCNG